MTSAGFPHSDISGSTPACDSPELFAANHVLHRLLTPRHSSCALSSLTTNLLWAALAPLRKTTQLVPRKLAGGISHQNFATRRSSSNYHRDRNPEGSRTFPRWFPPSEARRTSRDTGSPNRPALDCSFAEQGRD